ncbi:MAG TPA: GDSL-type esterase/lipase family protein, partial [Phycisphaerae bacterium]
MTKTFAQYLISIATLAVGAIIAIAQTAPTTTPASQPAGPPKPGPAAATLPAEIPKPAAGHKPTIFIIGDSTVKNGADNGATMGEWGWGHILHYYFDTSKATIENDAVGGTSSRSFMETPSMWPRLLPKIQPGDYVIMQFGHNDNTRPPESDTLRYRSTVSGNGENTVVGPVDPTQGGGTEVIHSFGWYIRQFVIITRGKGATAIVCSLIPRDNWSAAGKVNRADNGYALWAKQAAEQSGGLFLPLNKLVADEYDKLGRAKIVADYFPAGETTHTNWTGAR